MTTLLHIVHPYVYKIERMGGPFLFDDSAEQFKDRNNEIRKFIKLSKKAGIATLVYWETPLDLPSYSLAAILEDDNLSSMLPPDYAVSTPYCGAPQNQPGYTTPKEYAKLVIPFKRHFLIGGALEACVADAACHVRNLTNAPISIIEKHCVSFDREHAERLKKTLFPSKNINIV